MVKSLILTFIGWYQKTLSPDHSRFKTLFPQGYCKYSPSCSMYCSGVIEHFGVIKGVPLCVWRILRCNPWSKGGKDPVPERK